MAIVKVGLVCALVLVGGVVSMRPKWHQLDGYTFEQFERDFQKTYRSENERSSRKAVFNAKLADIQAHNADESSMYKRGVNHFADMTTAELKGFRGLNKALLYDQMKNEGVDVFTMQPHQYEVESVPSSVDYRKAYPNILTPVKNQAQCGSCWTFASTEGLETQFAMKHGFIQELSEQFILDCTPNPHECGGTGGCAGGTGELAYAKIKELGGQPTEWVYPYESALGNASKCHGLPLVPQAPHMGAVNSAVNISGYMNVPSNNYTAMMHASASNGAFAISVDAGAWHDYEEGIFDGGNHTNPDLDHLVQLVGYGSEDGKDYWIVRNSWTPLWGEMGFIRLKRDSNPTCGMDITPLDGNGCKGGPPQVKVCGQSGLLYDGVIPVVE